MEWITHRIKEENAFMENLKNAISKGIATFNVKTNNMLESNKCKTYIAALEKELAELECTIGKSVYDKWKPGEICIEGMDGIFSQIEERHKLIEEQKNLIEKIKKEEERYLGSNQGIIYCTACGGANKKGFKFCVKCGVSLEG